MKTKNKKPLSDEEFDVFFKNQLEDHSIQPSPSNWKSIRRWSGFLFLKKVETSTLLAYAAAISLFIICGLYFFAVPTEDIAFSKVAEASSETPVESAIDLSTSEKNTPSFVLDIPIEDIAEQPEEVVREIIIETAIEDYLAFLLADEDEFAGKVDSSKIANGLALAEQLPIDEMFEQIPSLPAQKVYTIHAPLEKRITLPHRFVDNESEVQDFLAHYEKNQQHSN